MIKLSHISILLISFLLLTSCFGGGGESSGAGLTGYKGEGFNIKIPTSWKVLSVESDSLPSPSSGEIVLSVSSPDVKSGFSNNLLVLKESVDSSLSSEEFSSLTHLGAKDEYYFYDKTGEKTIKFTDDVSSKLYVFDAKYNRNTPNLQFLQTARVCENKGYMITIAVSSSGNPDKYEDILKTFECK